MVPAVHHLPSSGVGSEVWSVKKNLGGFPSQDPEFSQRSWCSPEVAEIWGEGSRVPAGDLVYLEHQQEQDMMNEAVWPAAGEELTPQLLWCMRGSPAGCLAHVQPDPSTDPSVRRPKQHRRWDPTTERLGFGRIPRLFHRAATCVWNDGEGGQGLDRRGRKANATVLTTTKLFFHVHYIYIHI